MTLILKTVNFFLFFNLTSIFVTKISHVECYFSRRLSRTYGLHHHRNRMEIEKYIQEFRIRLDIPTSNSKNVLMPIEVTRQREFISHNDHVNGSKTGTRRKSTTSVTPHAEKNTTYSSYYDVGEILIDDEPDESESQNEYAEERRRIGKRKKKNPTETQIVSQTETTTNTETFPPTDVPQAETYAEKIQMDPSESKFGFKPAPKFADLQYGSNCIPTEEPEPDDCIMSSYQRMQEKHYDSHSQPLDPKGDESHSLSEDEKDSTDILFCNPESRKCTCLVTDNDKPLKWSAERKSCLLPEYFLCTHDLQCDHGLECLNSTLKDYDKDPDLARGYPTICKTSGQNLNIGNIAHLLNPLNYKNLNFPLLFFFIPLRFLVSLIYRL